MHDKFWDLFDNEKFLTAITVVLLQNCKIYGIVLVSIEFCFIF